VSELYDLEIERVDGVDDPATRRKWIVVKQRAPRLPEKPAARPARKAPTVVAKADADTGSDPDPDEADESVDEAAIAAILEAADTVLRRFAADPPDNAAHAHALNSLAKAAGSDVRFAPARTASHTDRSGRDEYVAARKRAERLRKQRESRLRRTDAVERGIDEDEDLDEGDDLARELPRMVARAATAAVTTALRIKRSHGPSRIARGMVTCPACDGWGQIDDPAKVAEIRGIVGNIYDTPGQDMPGETSQGGMCPACGGTGTLDTEADYDVISALQEAGYQTAGAPSYDSGSFQSRRAMPIRRGAPQKPYALPSRQAPDRGEVAKGRGPKLGEGLFADAVFAG
jgi:hypothetical protein